MLCFDVILGMMSLLPPIVIGVTKGESHLCLILGGRCIVDLGILWLFSG